MPPLTERRCGTPQKQLICNPNQHSTTFRFALPARSTFVNKDKRTTDVVLRASDRNAPSAHEFRCKVLRGWKQKYEVLLGLVKEPVRLLPESLTQEAAMLRAKRQGFAIERALVQANIDAWENTGCAKTVRRFKDRPENIRSLYEQVANLDCMLTSLETQIEVITSVHSSLPKEFHDTFHDSGTSGHEPDSLEAIHTLVGRGPSGSPPLAKPLLQRRSSARQQPKDVVSDNTDLDEGRGSSTSSSNGSSSGGGGTRGVSEAGVLLHLERCAHRQTRRALQELKEKYEAVLDEQKQLHHQPSRTRLAGSVLESLQNELDAGLTSLESLSSVASTDRLIDELKLREMTISQLRVRVLQLEKDRMDKVPVDAAREINRLNVQLIHLERARDELTLQNFTLKSRLSQVANNINDPAATYQINKDGPLSVKETNKSSENNNLNDVGKETSVDDPDVVKILRKSTYKVTEESQIMRQLCKEYEAKELEYKKKIEALELELRNVQHSTCEKHEKSIRDLEAFLEKQQQKVESMERFLEEKEEECNMLKLDVDTVTEENAKLQKTLKQLTDEKQEQEALVTTHRRTEDTLKKLMEENRVLAEDFNRERVLRKKYYNQIEDMKGKIRVFCRLRPPTELERRRGSEDVTQVEDQFSLGVNSTRGYKSFVFDRVFKPHESQEAVFQDTNALIQSAMDGYNTTIMAYGQTGSGKTYTMIGEAGSPGIAPRAFNRLFELAEEGRARQEVQIHCYMLELYNDKLIDLLRGNSHIEPEKLEVKRDKRGSVHVQGALVRHVNTAQHLHEVFEEGLSNRHTSSTNMNAESSRSHLLIVITVTVTSKQNGSVLRGKLTLVDLAGSERTHKSGAAAETLKEANSINKSLSALGDVIAALSSEASFVPYRNSKLTMLLQDSLGGNAKTLVFVNISPALYNVEESVVSLMYASRIKQITNTACKNADTREITRLKTIISKLKRGEDPGDDSLLTVVC
ncbi:kinesin-like protein KIN-14I isoform X1 [Hyalella azteca]|uniref:Kinesin-like protein n=2 Tax=Hyalella azteca TaxID=294128 RepID=A0A8B7P9Z1_HYAAZ|nr:kinesin-like protein KIN-14I isoform X1 [Hyalella azteca]